MVQKIVFIALIAFMILGCVTNYILEAKDKN